MRRTLVALLLLGCGSADEPPAFSFSCEPDCPEDWPAPDAAGGGGGKLPIHLRDGAAADSAPEPDAGPDSTDPRRIGDACYLNHQPGTVCMLDGGSLGCSTWPTRCEPFEDGG